MKLRVPSEVELQDAHNAAEPQRNTDEETVGNDIVVVVVEGAFYAKNLLSSPSVIFASSSISSWVR